MSASQPPATSVSASQFPAMSRQPTGSATAPDGNDREQECLSREKRRIRELEDEVERLRSCKEAKRLNSASTVNKGRALRRVVALFDNPTDLVRENDRRAEIAEQGLDDEDDPFPHSLGQDRLYRGFLEFVDFFPWIRAQLTDSEPAELERTFKEIRRGGDGARGDDASITKKEVVNWLTAIYGPIHPAISPAMKSDRGLDHDITGRLLCSIEYDWNDPEVKKNIHERHPDFLVTDASWPRFLYDTGYQYDPNNIEMGLFKSTLLLKTFKLIFTSPSSAQEVSASEHPETRNAGRCWRSSTDKSTRSHVAALIGMRSVKPRAIAYAAVQLRFALSSLTCWRHTDGDFHIPSFYQSIIDYFEAPPGPVAKTRVQELLLWWDRKVFGPHREIPRAAEQVAVSSVSRLAAQRTAAEAPPQEPNAAAVAAPQQ